MNTMDTQQEYEKREYTQPDIVAELELEVRAGSSLGLPDGVDIFEP